MLKLEKSLADICQGVGHSWPMAAHWPAASYKNSDRKSSKRITPIGTGRNSWNYSAIVSKNAVRSYKTFRTPSQFVHRICESLLQAGHIQKLVKDLFKFDSEGGWLVQSSWFVLTVDSWSKWNISTWTPVLHIDLSSIRRLTDFGEGTDWLSSISQFLAWFSH